MLEAMSHGRSFLTTIVIITEAFFLLLPSTLFFLAGFIFAIFGFFQANEGLTPAFLILAGILLLPGLGLYSLWWLVFKHRVVSGKEVPVYIWAAIAIGCMFALLFSAPYVVKGFAPPTEGISTWSNLQNFSIVGGGPLVMAASLLIIMQPWRDGSDNF